MSPRRTRPLRVLQCESFCAICGTHCCGGLLFRWRFSAADKIDGSVGIASDGTLLFGSEDDHVYAVSPDGTLLWFVALDGDVDTTPALARDGTLYVAGDDRTLRAFR